MVMALKNQYMRNLTYKALKAISVLVTLTGCEYHKESILQNQTGQEIDLIIHFNKKRLEDTWGGRPYIPFIQQYGDGPGVTLEKFDSVNLVSHYKIEDNGSFEIDQGIGGKRHKPSFNELITFKVCYKGDSTTIVDQEGFDRYFISRDDSNYIWTLK